MADTLKQEMIDLQKELYKRELSIEMDALYASFQKWKRNECEVFELTNQIHTFYKGASKEIFLKYERPSFADLNIANAVINGILKMEELSEELQPLISKKVKILQRD